jgi:Zn-dependent protease with chaperone function
MLIRRIDIPKTAELTSIHSVMFQAGGVGLMARADNVAFEDYFDALPLVCRNAGLTQDERFVFVLEEVKSYLNEDEITAVMAHEEGHYVLGHLDIVGSGNITTDAFEYAADDYAVGKVGAAALRSALINLRRFVLDVVFPQIYGEIVNADFRQVMAPILEQQMAPRLDRLTAIG